MKLTRSIEYALAATGYIAQNAQSQPVLAKKIAQHHKIPLEYLLKILRQLVRANIVHSIRGPQGGFLLARTPEKISLLQIIQAVEAPFNSNAALSLDKLHDPYCRAAIEAFQQAVRQATQKLSQTSLAELINPNPDV